jgi:hypothetical protein
MYYLATDELGTSAPLPPLKHTQAKLEEIIRQKNVDENYANAMEYNPESFGSVSML